MECPRITWAASRLSAALSFGNVGPTTSSFEYKEGETVQAGDAVQADCSGGKAPENYVVTVVATLDNGSERGKKFRFEVR